MAAPAVRSAAAGRVVTGFSKPYVAKYNVSSEGVISYTNGMVLARGVSVSLDTESSDSNIFYADNTMAEEISGEFTGGTCTLTVDGLLMSAEKMIMGLPEADETGWSTYDDRQTQVFVGIGYIVRYMSGNVVSYVPNILVKGKFDQIKEEAQTQGEEIDWQSKELSAELFRADDANHSWRKIGAEYETEALAEAALKTALGIS